jgi:Uma2 family endonuclease
MSKHRTDVSASGFPAGITPTLPPPLESGDRLTRAEFERRYDAMPSVKKAELIEGVVFMGSPVRFEHHAEPHIFIATWLGTYRAMTPGVRAADNATVRLDSENEPQPDALLFIAAECGGNVVVTADNYLAGAPELIVEIAASSASYDLHGKREAYRRSGVREYVVWRALEGELDWFRLRDREYERISPDAAGVIRSEAFPGLHLAVAALLAGEMAQVLETLNAGLATAEHRAFVETLAARRAKTK